MKSYLLFISIVQCSSLAIHEVTRGSVEHARAGWEYKYCLNTLNHQGCWESWTRVAPEQCLASPADAGNFEIMEYFLNGATSCHTVVQELSSCWLSAPRAPDDDCGPQRYGLGMRAAVWQKTQESQAIHEVARPAGWEYKFCLDTVQIQHCWNGDYRRRTPEQCLASTAEIGNFEVMEYFTGEVASCQAVATEISCWLAGPRVPDDECGADRYGRASRAAVWQWTQQSLATATGDPHIKNYDGVKFQVSKPGKKVLLQIDEDFVLTGNVAQVARDACKGAYISDVSVSGEKFGMTGKQRRTALSVNSSMDGLVLEDNMLAKMRFGSVGISRNTTLLELTFEQVHVRVVNKVTRRRSHLNIYVTGLKSVARDRVKGLLGTSPHEDEDEYVAEVCRAKVGKHMASVPVDDFDAVDAFVV